jgi:flavin-dependent dehydrogenase
VPRRAPVYVVGDAGGFADALSGEGIYHALESGRLAGLTAVEHAHGQGTYRRYYRRLWRSVLPDTLLTYVLSRFFYQHIAGSVRVLQHPLVWRPFVEGYAAGATLAQSLALGGYFQLSSLWRHSLSVGSSGAPHPTLVAEVARVSAQSGGERA